MRCSSYTAHIDTYTVFYSYRTLSVGQFFKLAVNFISQFIKPIMGRKNSLTAVSAVIFAWSVVNYS